jgi:hypothetical protein
MTNNEICTQAQRFFVQTDALIEVIRIALVIEAIETE